MNLVEAVKSGQPFKRAGWGNYVIHETVYQFLFKREDLLAEDWEVQEKEITITASQFDAAVSRTNDKVYKSEYEDVHICDYLKVLQRELGL